MVQSLSRVLFWDINSADLDAKKNAVFIIQRVLTLGTWQDFELIKAHYGKDVLRDHIKQIRSLDNRTMRFCEVYFSIPKHELRCYKEKQLKQAHWNY